MHFTAILARKGWSFYTFLKGSELCLAISGAALTLLWPVCTNLIIPYYLWRPPRVFLSRCSLPHFCSLLLFNQPSSVSPAPLTSACLLTCLEWTFSLSSLSVGARQGVDGTSDVTLKMWLGWMAPLCRRGSGSSFQLCFDKHVFFPAGRPVWQVASVGVMVSQGELTLVILGRLDALVMVIKGWQT